jgi:hypothetical protein
MEAGWARASDGSGRVKCEVCVVGFFGFWIFESGVL